MVRSSTPLAALLLAVPALAVPFSNNPQSASKPLCKQFTPPANELFVKDGFKNVDASHFKSSDGAMTAQFSTDEGLIFTPKSTPSTVKYVKIFLEAQEDGPHRYIKSNQDGPCQVDGSKLWDSVTKIQIYNPSVKIDKRELNASPKECCILDFSDEDGTYSFDKKNPYSIKNGKDFSSPEIVKSTQMGMVPAVRGSLSKAGLTLTPSVALENPYNLFIEYNVPGSKDLKTVLLQTYLNEPCVATGSAQWTKITKVKRATFYPN